MFNTKKQYYQDNKKKILEYNKRRYYEKVKIKPIIDRIVEIKKNVKVYF
jgi:hypothetical protein